MASSISPDLSFTVLPTDYLAALETDGQRWEDPSSSRKPVWAGRPVWCLLRGTEERTLWRVKAFDGERSYQQQVQAATTATVAAAIVGASFRSARELEDVACQRIVAGLGRALTPYEHSRVITSAKELWRIATASVVEVFEITEAGKAALAETPNVELVA